MIRKRVKHSDTQHGITLLTAIQKERLPQLGTHTSPREFPSQQLHPGHSNFSSRRECAYHTFVQMLLKQLTIDNIERTRGPKQLNDQKNYTTLNSRMNFN